MRNRTLAQEMVLSSDPAKKRLGMDILAALENGKPPVTGRLVMSDGAGGFVGKPLSMKGGRYSLWEEAQ